MSQLGSFLGSQVVGGLFGLAQAAREDKRKEQFRQEQLARADEARGFLFEPLDRLLADTERFASESLAFSEDFLGSAGSRFAEVADPLRGMIRGRTQAGIAGANELVRFQQEREQRLLAEQAGLGEAERAELNRQFRNLEQTERSRLGGLGFSGSAVSSVASGARRAGAADLSLLNERLQRERVGLSERLSAETLQSRAGALEFATGLRGEQIQGLGDLGFAGLDFEQQAFADILAARERFGLMPAQQAVAGGERMASFITEDVLFEPPVVGTANNLLFQSGQRG